MFRPLDHCLTRTWLGHCEVGGGGGGASSTGLASAMVGGGDLLDVTLATGGREGGLLAASGILQILGLGIANMQTIAYCSVSR